MISTTGRAPRSADEALLRRTAIVFLAALIVHGADHAVRGLDVITELVSTAGSIQFLLGVIAVLLVFMRHRSAPTLAILVGFPSAVGFAMAHLLPEWGAFSDPYVGANVAPGVTWFSWFTALFEIAADLAFGWAGLRARRTMGVPDAATSGVG